MVYRNIGGNRSGVVPSNIVSSLYRYEIYMGVGWGWYGLQLTQMLKTLAYSASKKKKNIFARISDHVVQE